jgi:hypothetical protein
MIRINKSSINNIVVTLTEKTTIVNPFYLMDVYSNQTQESKVVSMGSDISSNKTRWNEFSITENSAEDLLNGVISLNEGTYDYFIWESAIDDNILSTATGIVESGKLVVIGNTVTTTTYNNTKTKVVYNG